jgi:uncharacterized protein
VLCNHSLQKVLIIGHSARMLTQAALNSGLVPYVIDCYADQDTKQSAKAYRCVFSLRRQNLQLAVQNFKQQGISYLIYGSGFENYPDSLLFLERQFKILGNCAKTFLRLQKKREFFQTLQQLNIAYPETCFAAPKDKHNWLIKPEHSLGGCNIRFFSSYLSYESPSNGYYYQRYLNGESLSALFLSNGRQAQIIGFNRQLTTKLDNQDFIFSGVINHAQLPTTIQQTLIAWIHQLTRHYGLRGLNSLDFILSNNCCYVLEINARPPASMQLYDDALLTAHLNSVQTGRLRLPFPQRLCKAYYIVYAHRQTHIVQTIPFGKGYADIPPRGAIIGKNQPICSIIASGKTLSALQHDLHLKQSFLSTYLTF